MNKTSLKEALIDSMYYPTGARKLGADVGWTDLGCDVKMDDVPMSDFFVMKQNPTNSQNGNSGEDDVDLIVDQVDFWR
jgi:hypothetical protein